MCVRFVHFQTHLHFADIPRDIPGFHQFLSELGSGGKGCYQMLNVVSFLLCLALPCYGMEQQMSSQPVIGVLTVPLLSSGCITARESLDQAAKAEGGVWKIKLPAIIAEHIMDA